MNSKHGIAVIQLHPKPMDLVGNFDRSCRFIRAAASKGAELAVLPEYHLSGWEPTHPEFFTTTIKTAEYLRKYCVLASELNICIVPGTMLENVNECIMNTAYFISNTGTILSSYSKKNLWHTERGHLKSSQEAPHIAFDTPLGRVGMLICWDLAFPEAFRALIRDGAKTIIVPAFWTLDDCGQVGRAHNRSAEALLLESLLISRAYENTCAMIFANAGHDAQENSVVDYAGLSQVTVPFLGCVDKLDSKEGMLVVRLCMSLVEEAEENYKVRLDLARDDWHYPQGGQKPVLRAMI